MWKCSNTDNINTKQTTGCYKIKEHSVNETGVYGIWKFIKSL